MYSKIWLFFVFCCLSHFACAQSQDVSQRVHRWRNAYMSGQMEPSAVRDSCQYWKSAFQSHATPPSLADFWSLWGNAILDEGKPSEALALHQQSLRIRRTFKDKPMLDEQANSWLNIGNCYWDLGKIDLCGQAYQTAWKLKSSIHPPKDSSTINAAICLANYYFVTGDTAKAGQYYRNAVEAATKNFGPYSTKISTSLLALAEFERSSKHPKQVLSLMEQLLDIEQKSKTPAPKKIADAHSNLMNAAIEAKNYQKAVYHGEIAAQMLTLSEYPTDRGICLLNLSTAWRELGDPNRALMYGYECRSLIGNGQQEMDLLSTMAAAHTDLGETEVARQLLQEGIRVGRIHQISDPVTLATLWMDFGDTWYLDKQWQQAIEAYQKGIKAVETCEDRATKSDFLCHLWLKHAWSHHQLQQPTNAFNDCKQAEYWAKGNAFNTSLVYKTMGDWSLQRGDPSAALAYFEQAISLLPPETNQYERCELTIKISKTRLHSARKTHQKADFMAVLEQATLATTDLEKLTASTKFGDASFELRHTFFSIYGIGVEAALCTDDTLGALVWSERGKKFHQQLNRATSESGTTQPLLSKDQLEQWRKQLAPDHTMLAYHWAEDRIFAFVIGHKGLFAYQLTDNILAIEQATAQLYALCSTHPNDLSAIQRDSAANQLVQSSHALYRALIHPFSDRLGGQLTIIPDGLLHYIPFEALIETPTDQPYLFQKHAYLLWRHTIAYTTSLGQYFTPAAAGTQILKGDFLAIAPIFVGRNKGLDSLRFNRAEADSVVLLTHAELLAGDAAQKSVVTQLLPQYRVVHLATHGSADVQHASYSFIACSDTRDVGGTQDYQLYVAELSQLRLDRTELVVLSACKTAFGKVRRGEGLLSIAHAIEQTGADALIASLWNVDDANTPQLMRNLYQHLGTSASKSEALTMAKRGYIRALPNSERLRAHPFFWAGFILTGDPKPLSMYAHSAYWWYFLIGGVGVGLVLLIYRNRELLNL